tara:strand:+ start:18 stop:197 length:180 start_codon:yes stop_codon:yes gene_type:complete
VFAYTEKAVTAAKQDKIIFFILLILVFDGIHTFQPIHAEPLVLTSLGASAADASKLFVV